MRGREQGEKKGEGGRKRKNKKGERRRKEKGEREEKKKKKKKRGAGEIRGDGREPIVASTRSDAHEKRGVQEKD